MSLYGYGVRWYLDLLLSYRGSVSGGHERQSSHFIMATIILEWCDHWIRLVKSILLASVVAGTGPPYTFSIFHDKEESRPRRHYEQDTIAIEQERSDLSQPLARMTD